MRRDGFSTISWKIRASFGTSFVNDRHGHYGYGLNLAEAVEQAARRVSEAGGAQGEVVAAGAWFGRHAHAGRDRQRLARRGVASRGLGFNTVLRVVACAKKSPPHRHGIAGGLVALVLAALSPAGRFYATDMMLEALGAGLTMLALAFHTAAVEDRDCIWKSRGLAITLTLLFFEKYNYWILAVVPRSPCGIPDRSSPRRAGWLRAIDGKRPPASRCASR